MSTQDATLQELIVRALTGMDQRAKQAFDAASASDPELKQFCAELDEVVSLLSGSRDWRAAPPPPEVRERVRQAVAQKLPAAPPHFRKVMLESDLGRRRTMSGLIIVVVMVGVCLALLVGWVTWRSSSGSTLKLEGTLVRETSFKDMADVREFNTFGETLWYASNDGLRPEGGEEPAALVNNQTTPASQALGLDADIKVPGLDARSSVMVFIAEGSGGPAFNAGLRPASALAVEITSEGISVFGPDQAPLRTRTVAQSEPRFVRLRLEHLGPRVRVLVNGETLFDGPIMRPLRGNLSAGLRLSGPQKNAVRFNAFRIQR
ncbi:MAG TPA: hypothetical protein VEJ63_18860 [Planctomycetota bacterium]|nr:hypothetical protein [Planctomycetota bacterium]